MNNSEITALRDRLPEYLERVHGIGNARHNFRCLNPAHDDSSPSMGFDAAQKRVHCFGCGASWDIFDLAAVDAGLGVEAPFTAKAKAVCDALGEPCPDTGAPIKKGRKAAANPPRKVPIKCSAESCLDAVQRASWKLLTDKEGAGALEYLHSRGFSDEVLAQHLIGFSGMPSRDFGSLFVKGGWYREAGYIVLPFMDVRGTDNATPDGLLWECDYITLRPVDPSSTELEYGKERKPQGQPSLIWREYLLSGAVPGVSSAYVTEGILDAMSLKEIFSADGKSAHCLALNGNNVSRLIDLLYWVPAQKRPLLLLALDSDEAGRNMTERLARGLSSIGACFKVLPPYPDGCKDANEWLVRRGDKRV